MGDEKHKIITMLMGKIEKKNVLDSIQIYLQKYYGSVFKEKMNEQGFHVKGIENIKFEEDSLIELKNIWAFRAKANLIRSDFVSDINTNVGYEFAGNADIETYKNATSNDLISFVKSAEVTYLKEITTKQQENNEK